MTEPYRSSGRLCPACASVAVREHDDQLACDACHGRLLRVDELATALAETGGATEPITVRDPTPEPVRCPRCDRPMQRVTLQRGAHLLPGRFLACSKDGIWAPRETLAASYARPRRVPPTPRAITTGARRGLFASSQPRIGQYERPRPLVHTPFVSAFRGHQLTCPSCADGVLALAGDRWVCKGCAGTFVEDAALVAMISELVRAVWELPGPSGRVGERKCPVCGQGMTIEELEAVIVGRCAGHGWWFDDPDLQAALQHAGFRGS